MDKVTLGQGFFPSTSVSPTNFYTTDCPAVIYRFGADTIGQLVADVPSGLGLTPPQETKNVLEDCTGLTELKTESKFRDFMNMVIQFRNS
jgi:hypothetical protein